MKVKFDVKDVFNPKEYLYFYHRWLNSERLQKEIDFLVKYTHLDRPLKILDLACGHGRHANAIAGLGHDVTGIDITKGFLTLAKKEARSLGIKVDYRHDDMRNLDYKNAFDRIYVLFTAIGYFDDKENEQVFQKIFKALKPGGIFCFDSHNRDVFMTYHLPSTVIEREGNWMIDQHEFNTMTGRCRTKRAIIMNQATKKFEYSIRFYNPTEIINLFKRIGFSSIVFYGGWDGNELDSHSKRLIVVAKK